MTDAMQPAADQTNQAAQAQQSAAPASTATADVAKTTQQPAQAQQQTQQSPDAGKDKAAAAPTGAPDDYTFTPPDGFAIDPALTELAVPVFKELNLNQEQANKLAGLMPQISAYFQQQQEAARVQQSEDWARQTREDPELGGPQYEATVQAAQAAIARFAPQGFKQYLESTGLGNHPDMVRFCRSVYSLIREDSITGQGAPGAEGSNRSGAKVLFPDMN